MGEWANALKIYICWFSFSAKYNVYSWRL